MFLTVSGSHPDKPAAIHLTILVDLGYRDERRPCPSQWLGSGHIDIAECGGDPRVPHGQKIPWNFCVGVIVVNYVTLGMGLNIACFVGLSDTRIRGQALGEK